MEKPNVGFFNWHFPRTNTCTAAALSSLSGRSAPASQLLAWSPHIFGDTETLQVQPGTGQVSLPCSFGRWGWMHWCRRRTASRRFWAPTLWRSCSTHPENRKVTTLIHEIMMRRDKILSLQGWHVFKMFALLKPWESFWFYLQCQWNASHSSSLSGMKHLFSSDFFYGFDSVFFKPSITTTSKWTCRLTRFWGKGRGERSRVERWKQKKKMEKKLTLFFPLTVHLLTSLERHVSFWNTGRRVTECNLVWHSCVKSVIFSEPRSLRSRKELYWWDRNTRRGGMWVTSDCRNTSGEAASGY